MPQKLSWIAAAACITVYAVVAMQHPSQNFDDMALIPQFSDLVRRLGVWSAASYIFLGQDLPGEYRTYSLSRVLQLFLSLSLGGRPTGYFAIMATAWIVGAGLLFLVVRKLTDTATAIGAAAIWLFSPFSICRTFHHFSYIILPAVLLLGYILLMQIGRKRVAVSLLFVIPLFGEQTIPPLLAAAVLMNWKQWRDIAIHLASVASVVFLHYSVLRYVNGYDGQQRFVPIVATVEEKISAFAGSIWSTAARAFQIDVTDFEPYTWGAQIHGFAWQNLNALFFLCAVALGVVVVTPLVTADKNQQASRPAIIGIALFTASLWGIFPPMIAATSLYTHVFTLQIRSGYIVLPAAFILAFILLRRSPLRRLAVVIPLLMIVGWSLNAAVVVPAQKSADLAIEQMLSDAKKAGAEFLVIPKAYSAMYRENGLIDPYLITASTPFQQDWTTWTKLYEYGITTAKSATEIEGSADFVLLGGELNERNVVERNKVFASRAPVDSFLPEPPEIVSFGFGSNSLTPISSASPAAFSFTAPAAHE